MWVETTRSSCPSHGRLRGAASRSAAIAALCRQRQVLLKAIKNALLQVTTFLGEPTLPHWRSRCSGQAVTLAARSLPRMIKTFRHFTERVSG
jgi:hypothetical protein